jgi:hypothetical protein
MVVDGFDDKIIDFGTFKAIPSQVFTGETWDGTKPFFKSRKVERFFNK